MPEPDAIVYTDGGSRGNPGPAGIGVVIVSDGKTACRLSEPLGVTTNLSWLTFPPVSGAD